MLAETCARDRPRRSSPWPRGKPNNKRSKYVCLISLRRREARALSSRSWEKQSCLNDAKKKKKRLVFLFYVCVCVSVTTQTHHAASQQVYLELETPTTTHRPPPPTSGRHYSILHARGGVCYYFWGRAATPQCVTSGPPVNKTTKKKKKSLLLRSGWTVTFRGDAALCFVHLWMHRYKIKALKQICFTSTSNLFYLL